MIIPAKFNGFYAIIISEKATEALEGTMTGKCRCLVALLAVVLCGTGLVSADVQYTVTDLGALPGDTNSYPTSINKVGQVCGYSFSPGGNTRSWLYGSGTMTPLGSLLPGGTTFANAINDAGQVVGRSLEPNGDHAFLYSNGSMQDIGSLGGGGGVALGINNSGAIVGNSTVAGDNSDLRAFLYSNGSMQDLGTLPGGNTAIAYAINGSGQIAGSSGVGGAGHAFLFDQGTMHDLGTLGGANSGAFAISGLGHAVGTSQTTGSTLRHAFIYADGVMQDLVALGGSPDTFAFDTAAYGVNDLDEVVGYGDSHTVNHAFLYSSGTLYNLNDLIDPSSGATLINAVGINDTGQIVAYGGAAQFPGDVHAFLLTPTPEPSAVCVAGMAAYGLLARRHRRR